MSKEIGELIKDLKGRWSKIEDKVIVNNTR